VLGNGGPDPQEQEQEPSVIEQEQDKGPEYSLCIRREGEETLMGAEMAPSPWSSTWAQALEESKRLRESEERFSWMKEADIQMLHLGLEPYPWDQFAEEVAKTGETEFQVIEQRGSAEEVFRANLPLEMNSIIGATLVVRSRTIVTTLKMVSDLGSAPQATARMFSMLAVSLPEGAQVDLIISSDAVLAALGACADILSHEGTSIATAGMRTGRTSWYCGRTSTSEQWHER
jgi:hypothetical protein